MDVDNTSQAGAKPLAVTRIRVKGASFSLSEESTSSIDLQPGEALVVGITFRPVKAGRHRGSVEIFSNARGDAVTSVRLSGEAESQHTGE